MAFTPDHRAFGRFLTSERMRLAMVARAEKGKVFAEAVAPVYEKGPHPGRYKSRFRVESGVQHHKTSRAYAELVNDAPEALFVEYGTKNNRAHHVLLRSIDAMRG